MAKVASAFEVSRRVAVLLIFLSTAAARFNLLRLLHRLPKRVT
jgi:hypothetical protein